MPSEWYHELPSTSEYHGNAVGRGSTYSVAREKARARSGMYGFLAAYFLGPPKEELVRYLVGQGFLYELQAQFGEQAVSRMRVSCPSDRLSEDIALVRKEYMDLFVMPSARYVTPFEDVYRGRSAVGEVGRGRLIGELTILLRRRYREAGAEVVRTCRQLPSHIGVELSFMSFLCDKEASSVGSREYALPDPANGGPEDPFRYRRFQYRFLQEHLNEWFPDLSRSIQTHARGGLYRGLALICEEFLAWDTGRLAAGAGTERL